MPDEVIPKEIKYEFKTEQEKLDAINALPEDAPIGVDVAEWQSEQETTLNLIVETPVLSEEDAAAVAAAAAVEGAKPAEETPPVETPAQNTDPNEDLQKQFNYLKQQQDEMQANYESRLISQQTEHEQKIKDLKVETTPAAKVEETGEVDSKIKEAQNRIAAIHVEMDTIKKSGSTFDDTTYMDKMQQVQRIQGEVDTYRSQKQSKLENTLHEMKLEATTREEERVADEKKSQQAREIQAQKDKVNEKMEIFRDKHEELKGDTFTKMEDEFVEFGKQVASVYYGKPTNTITAAELEMAMIKYGQKTPSINDGLSQRGIKAPVNLDKYNLLSDVKMAMQGQQLNKSTGLWDFILNEAGQKSNLPSFEDAYIYIKRKSGTLQQDNLDAGSAAVKEFSNASQQRATVTELGSEHQKQDVTEVSREEHLRIINSIDEEEQVLIKRRNPNSPVVIEIDKSLVALGFEPIAI